MRSILLLLAVSIIGLGQTAFCEELAKEVRDILKNRCFSCHGDSGANEGGFNYSLNRKRLVRELVVPGSVGDSKLFERISKGEMPPDGDRLSAAETDKIQKWIEDGAPNFAAEIERKFITPLEMHTAMRDDLVKAFERDRPFMRYFTLTHLYNAGFEDNELESHRRGLSKLLNSLSWGREVRVPIPIDEHKTILRIDLRNYKWNETDGWSHIVAANPYQVEFKDDIAMSCDSYTLCQQPHVRADWFVFAASRPPLYNVILGLPETSKQFVKFEKERLGVDVARNLKDYNNVLRAGFYPSGVSKSNRLIERHESLYGAYWKSYDFKPVDAKQGNIRRSNLKAHPMGPEAEQGFEHDGGEMIFNLPNGLQAYMLTDATGKQIPKGPTDVVVDKEAVSRGRDPEVINGVSCMNCHWSGMLKKSDQIRDHVLKQQSSYPPKVVEFVKAVYTERKELDAMFQQDRERFELAVKKCGLVSLSKTEPVAALAFQFDEPLDLDLAAAEAGVESSELKTTLAQSAELGRQLGSLSLGQAVPRETYVANFRSIIQELHLKKMLESQPEEFRNIVTAVNLWNGIGVKVDQPGASKMILELSRTKNPIAMGLAANLYYAGRMVSKNTQEAERLALYAIEPLSRLAEGNDLQATMAQLVLGDLYAVGVGTSKDRGKAKSLYLKASEANHPVAALSLAIIHLDEKNFTEAIYWAKKAASKDLPEGNSLLGFIHGQGIGVPQDFNVAKSLLLKAAAQNSPRALGQLGNLYYRGLGVGKDLAEALRLGESSALQNDPVGQELLGQMYFEGDGVEKDFQKALSLLHKAAEQKHIGANLKLAEIFENGSGVPKDMVKAVQFYSQTADFGLAIAQRKLGDIYRFGNGVPINYSEALKWYKLAANQNQFDSMISLINMNLAGQGTPQNVAEARMWTNKAKEVISLDNPPAQLLEKRKEFIASSLDIIASREGK